MRFQKCIFSESHLKKAIAEVKKDTRWKKVLNVLPQEEHREEVVGTLAKLTPEGRATLFCVVDAVKKESAQVVMQVIGKGYEGESVRVAEMLIHFLEEVEKEGYKKEFEKILGNITRKQLAKFPERFALVPIGKILKSATKGVSIWKLTFLGKHLLKVFNQDITDIHDKVLLFRFYRLCIREAKEEMEREEVRSAG